MTKRTISITYEITTPESVEDGDVSESGWIDGSSTCDGTEYTIDEAIALLSRKCLEPSSSEFHSGIWYSDADANVNYTASSRAPGEEERHSYHLKGFTEREQLWVYKSVRG